MALSQWLHANKAATNTTMKRTLTRSGRQDTTIHSYAFPLIAQDVSAKLIVNVSNYFACRKSKPHSRNEARRRRVGVATPNRPSGFRDLNACPTGSQIAPDDRGGRHARQSRSATPAAAGELPLRAVMPISGRQSNDGYDLDRGPSQGDPRRRTSAHLRRPRPRPAMSAQRRLQPSPVRKEQSFGFWLFRGRWQCSKDRMSIEVFMMMTGRQPFVGGNNPIGDCEPRTP
jgi:hypothetical protein